MTLGQRAATLGAAAASALGHGPKQTCQKVVHSGQPADGGGEGVLVSEPHPFS